MIAAVATLLGGIGLFLLGMGMLTEGLKVAAGPALRTLLERWTSSAPRGLLAGILITALVQSSSAVTVATVGFVNAGLLSLSQAVWVMFGANIGTTMTAWLVAMVGVKLDVGALALPLLGLGMLGALLSRRHTRLQGLGRAIAGFGAFFLGIGILQQGFSGITDLISPGLDNLGNSPFAVLAFVALGFLLTALTQSSSAAIAIALTAASAGTISLLPAAAVVVGTNIGTTSTAIFASIGATPAARRVAMAHVAFNLLTGAVALLLLSPLLAASQWLAALFTGNGLPATVLAVFHTLFNLLGLILIWPMAPWLVRRLSGMFLTDRENMARPRFLDAPLAEVPALAIRGLVLEISNMAARLFASARDRAEGTARTEGAELHDATLELGQAIRSFIAMVTTRPLPKEDVAALADLIRATQHLEATAAAAASINPGNRMPMGDVESWHALESAALAALELRVADEETAIELETLMRQVDQAYQSAKAQMLSQAASGRLRPDQLDVALAEAEALRRTAEHGLKAQRRLLPWVRLAAEQA